MTEPRKSVGCTGKFDRLHARAAELRRQGLSQAVIASRIGVSEKSISNWLSQARKAEEETPAKGPSNGAE